jgi:hypothetical protein
VQLRYQTGLTSEEYVSREAWREARLARCPLHPRGGCRFARHGTYARKHPPGARVARWRCPQGHWTFSLLPECLCARLRGTLERLEAVVLAIERAPNQEKAADALRPEVELPGALRWLRRQVRRVHTALHLLRSLEPERFQGWAATLGAWRARLGIAPVLPALCDIAAAHLPQLPAPLGLRARVPGGGDSRRARQHNTGTDPPPAPG